MKTHYKSDGYDADMGSAIRGGGGGKADTRTGDHGSRGPTSNSGGSQSTRGASVRSGLSSQKEFHGESNASLGMTTKDGRHNQVPCQPKHKISTDRGDFTCW